MMVLHEYNRGEPKEKPDRLETDSGVKTVWATSAECALPKYVVSNVMSYQLHTEETEQAQNFVKRIQRSRMQVKQLFRSREIQQNASKEAKSHEEELNIAEAEALRRLELIKKIRTDMKRRVCEEDETVEKVERVTRSLGRRIKPLYLEKEEEFERAQHLEYRKKCEDAWRRAKEMTKPLDFAGLKDHAKQVQDILHQRMNEMAETRRGLREKEVETHQKVKSLPKSSFYTAEQVRPATLRIKQELIVSRMKKAKEFARRVKLKGSKSTLGLIKQSFSNNGPTSHQKDEDEGTEQSRIARKSHIIVELEPDSVDEPSARTAVYHNRQETDASVIDLRVFLPRTRRSAKAKEIITLKERLGVSPGDRSLGAGGSEELNSPMPAAFMSHDRYKYIESQLSALNEKAARKEKLLKAAQRGLGREPIGPLLDSVCDTWVSTVQAKIKLLNEAL
jgi:hypothetical protein